MAKTIPSALQTHIEGEVTTLTSICTITRTDGVVVRLTSHDADVTVDGEVFKATYGFSRTASASTSGLDPDDVDLDGLANSGYINKSDLEAGLYNGATVLLQVVNYQSPSDGVITLKKGMLGETLQGGTDRFNLELRSLKGLMQQEIIEKSSPTCRAELGDTRCTVPIAPPVRQDSTTYAVGDFVRAVTSAGTGDQVYENRIYECTAAGDTAGAAPTFDTTDGATTSDGTVTWTARQAWTRSAVVNNVTDRRIFTLTITESRAVDDWFNLGTVTFQSGNNINRTIEVRDWVQSTNTITLFLPAPFTVQSGDVVSIVPGCDKLKATCKAKFALTGTTSFANGNVVNFRGEPDLPGRDAVFTFASPGFASNGTYVDRPGRPPGDEIEISQ